MSTSSRIISNLVVILFYYFCYASSQRCANDTKCNKECSSRKVSCHRLIQNSLKPSTTKRLHSLEKILKNHKVKNLVEIGLSYIERISYIIKNCEGITYHSVNSDALFSLSNRSLVQMDSINKHNISDSFADAVLFYLREYGCAFQLHTEHISNIMNHFKGTMC